MSESKIVWHKYPDEKPHKYDRYIVSVRAQDVSFTSTSYWLPNKDVFEVIWDICITAWAEMPEPYEEESDNAKYTLRDVITSPEDPRLKDAIGKRVYVHDSLNRVLTNANSDTDSEVLITIGESDVLPFTTKDEYGDHTDWACIILKKEDSE